jgi:hypothetical protein
VIPFLIDRKELQRIDTPAILDAKWSPHRESGEAPAITVADAKGALTIYALNPTTVSSYATSFRCYESYANI